MNTLRRLIASVLVIALIFTMTNLSSTIVYAGESTNDESDNVPVENGGEGSTQTIYIGETGYDKFSDALVGAKDGDTITLTGDTVLDKTVQISKHLNNKADNLTIDLGGYKLNANEYSIVFYNSKTTIKNGIINCTLAGATSNLWVYGATSDKGSDYTVATFNDVKVNALDAYGIIMDNLKNSSKELVSYGAVVNLNNSEVYSKYGIDTLGNIGKHQKTGFPVMNVKKSKIISSESGAYFAGYGIYNIENSEFIGESSFGIGIKAGDLTIKNSKIKCTGDLVEDTTTYSNGMNASGAALAVESNKDYSEPLKITIDNSTLDSAKGRAFYEYSDGKDAKSVISNLTVKNGSILNSFSAVSDSTNLVGLKISKHLNDKNNNCNITIENGTKFNNNNAVIYNYEYDSSAEKTKLTKVSEDGAKLVSTGFISPTQDVYETNDGYIVDSKLSVAPKVLPEGDEIIYLPKGEELAVISSPDANANMTDLAKNYLTNSNTSVISSSIETDAISLKATEIGTATITLNSVAQPIQYNVLVYDVIPDAYFNNGETVDLSSYKKVPDNVEVEYILDGEKNLQKHENSLSIIETKAGVEIPNSYSEDVTLKINNQLEKTIKVHVINPDIVYVQKGQTIELDKEYSLNNNTTPATSPTPSPSSTPSGNTENVGVVEITGKNVKGIGKGTVNLIAEDNSCLTVVVYEVEVTEKVHELEKSEQTVSTEQGEIVENTGNYENTADAVKTIVAETLKQDENNNIEFSQADTADKIKAAVVDNKSITSDVTKEEVSDTSNEEISGKSPADAKSEIEQKYINSGIATFYDVNFVLYAVDANNQNNKEEIGKITKLNKKVKITAPMPTIATPLGDNMQRKFSVIPFHNGVMGNPIDAALSNDGTELSYYVDEFSLFAITYEDTKSSGSSSSGGGGGSSTGTTTEPTTSPTPTTSPEPSTTPTPTTSPNDLTIGTEINEESNSMVSFVLSSKEDRITIENLKATYPESKVAAQDNKTLGTGDIVKVNGLEKALVIYGDVTGDGEMDIYDVVEMIKHIKNIVKLEDAKYIAANVDKNSEIDIFDVVKVISVVKGNTAYKNII